MDGNSYDKLEGLEHKRGRFFTTKVINLKHTYKLCMSVYCIRKSCYEHVLILEGDNGRLVKERFKIDESFSVIVRIHSQLKLSREREEVEDVGVLE